MTKNKNNETIQANEIASGLKKGVDAFGKLLSLASDNVISNLSGAEEKIKSHYTYLEERACLNCGTPLADQLPGKRTFCKEERDKNGKLIKDCKGLYNRLINKPSRDEQKAIVNELRTTDERIERMVAKKGNLVTTEDLDAYDIQLSSPLSYNINRYGQLTSLFLGFTIISNPISQTHKIKRND